MFKFTEDSTSIMVSYETNSEVLAAFIPELFQMTHPVLDIPYQMYRRMDWMARRGYRLISVGVPVAHVRGSERSARMER